MSSTTAATLDRRTAVLLVEAVGRAPVCAPVRLVDGDYRCGSSPGCEITVDATGVAAEHCTFHARDGQVTITAQAKETWLNDLPVFDQQVVQPGDRIALGPIVLRVRAATPADSAAPAARSQPATNESSRDSATRELRSHVQELSAHIQHQQNVLQTTPLAPPAPNTAAVDVQQSFAAVRTEILEQKTRELATRSVDLDLRVSEFEARAAHEREQLTAEQSQLQQRSDELDERERLLAQQEAATTRDHDQSQDRDQRLQEREQELVRRADELEALRSDLHQQRQQLERDQVQWQQRAADDDKSVAEQEHNAAELTAREAALAEQEAKLAEQEATLHEQAATLQQLRHELDEQMQQLQEREAELQQDRTAVETQRHELQTQHDELQARDAALTARETQLDVRENGITDAVDDKLRAEREAAATEQQRLTEELATLRTQLAEAREQAASDEEASQQNQARISELETLLEDAAAAPTPEESPEHTAALLEAQRNADELAARLEARDADFAAARAALDKIRAKHAEAMNENGQDRVVAELQAELEEAHRELETARSSLAEQRQKRPDPNASNPADTRALKQLRTDLDERDTTIARLQQEREAASDDAAELQRRLVDLDDRTRRLDERSDHVTDREATLTRQEAELSEERDRIRTARQELERARVAFQAEQDESPRQQAYEEPDAASYVPEHVEDSAEPEQHLSELRSELAGLFSMGASTGSSETVDDPSTSSAPGSLLETGGDPSSSDDADYVAEYMEQLLARTRARSTPGEESETPEPAPVKTEPATSGVSLETARFMAPQWSGCDEPVGGVVAEPREREPFETRRKPVRPIEPDAFRANMQSFRDVANYSARAAIANYAWKRRQGGLWLRAGLVAGSLFTAQASYIAGRIGALNLPGLTWGCLTVGSIAAVELAYTIVRLKKLKPKQADAPASETGVSETGIPETGASETNDNAPQE